MIGTLITLYLIAAPIVALFVWALVYGGSQHGDRP